jgi:NAD(P)H-dependent flavin oxidoreductase YrpB (nitropropane dioxygenase family)
MTPAAQPRRPVVIQGGMGVGVSSWQLAGVVAGGGELGVVSGTALDNVVARRLQDGDPGGHVRRVMAQFPVPAIVERIMRRYYRAEGRQGAPYAPAPRLAVSAVTAGAADSHSRRAADELSVLSNFVEVRLAQCSPDGVPHHGLVGVNYLEKIQMATPAAAYGAMMAGVDYVLMGAGIPRQIPRLLDDLAAGRPGTLTVEVIGGDPVTQTLDPTHVWDGEVPTLKRPQFLAIVSSHVLAQYLNRETGTRPDGFVVEGPIAGGHNAPPRGTLQLDDEGQPIYGPRDDANLEALAKVGLPFWLAGGHGEPEKVRAALEAGAAGVQVGTLFALSHESGLVPELRARLVKQLREGTLDVRTDAAASPTGFPFKVARLDGTLSDTDQREQRPRLCDLGYLRQPYQREGGAVGYRCPAEPIAIYVRKGGKAEDAAGAACLCNALMTDVGLGQERKDGYAEEPLVTLGSDLTGAKRLDDERWLVGNGAEGWPAADALAWLLRDVHRA